METIYLDTCALNRPSDDLTQPRVREEAQALGRILDHVAARRIEWYTSTAIQFEIGRNPDPLRRIRALDLLSSASRVLTPTPASFAQTARLAALGFSQLDALHLALAHEANMDWFITTDDRLIRKAERDLPAFRPSLINPVNWTRRRQPWLLP